MDNKEFEFNIKKKLRGKKIIIVSNREPYVHNRTVQGGIQIEKKAGGVHILLDSILKITGGTLISHGSGNADKEVVDKSNKIKVPPEKKLYTLKRVFLTKQELNNFYYGFANQTIWPLFHNVFIKPRFRTEWWTDYLKVNKKFAESVLEEITDDKNTIVWIHDYHFLPLAYFIKQKKPNVKTSFFLHIPWPDYLTYKVMPWNKELLEYFLNNDIIGFHRSDYVSHFVGCIQNSLEAKIQNEPLEVHFQGLPTKIKKVPAGIDYLVEHRLSKKSNREKLRTEIKKQFNIEFDILGISVDRLDYIKGLTEKIEIIDKFLEKHPQYNEKFVFLQLLALSRMRIKEYREAHKRIIEAIEKVNWKYSNFAWQPIKLITDLVEKETLHKFYKASDFCLITSLSDGLNLVAKEYIAAQGADGLGALLLSDFAGASKDIPEAYIINPYDQDQSVNKLYDCLNTSKKEKRDKISRMKERLKKQTCYDWALELLTGLE